MIEITKIFKFEASHHLPKHKGKCRNFHGHSYKLEVTISGELHTEGESSGMILDFGLLKEIVQNVILRWADHSNLNDYYENPTAEIMVKDIAKGLIVACGSVMVTKIRLWETSTSYATWRQNRC
jgi:6-pyruvoyltetrahydropterin/6-carboxytetrahydropterin synthase